MVQFIVAGLFEGAHLTASRVDPFQDRTDGAVLACGIHALKDQQQGELVVRIQFPLQFIQLLVKVVQLFL